MAIPPFGRSASLISGFGSLGLSGSRNNLITFNRDPVATGAYTTSFSYTISGGVQSAASTIAFHVADASAMPGPGTHATIAGTVALGLAAWHRRRV